MPKHKLAVYRGGQSPKAKARSIGERMSGSSLGSGESFKRLFLMSYLMALGKYPVPKARTEDMIADIQLALMEVSNFTTLDPELPDDYLSLLLPVLKKTGFSDEKVRSVAAAVVTVSSGSASGTSSAEARKEIADSLGVPSSSKGVVSAASIDPSKGKPAGYGQNTTALQKARTEHGIFSTQAWDAWHKRNADFWKGGGSW